MRAATSLSPIRPRTIAIIGYAQLFRSAAALAQKLVHDRYLLRQHFETRAPLRRPDHVQHILDVAIDGENLREQIQRQFRIARIIALVTLRRLFWIGLKGLSRQPHDDERRDHER